jgi:hypothetical protein
VALQSTPVKRNGFSGIAATSQVTGLVSAVFHRPSLKIAAQLSDWTNVE